jgi:glycosyltransferase involved in cell wall biosynthesis
MTQPTPVVLVSAYAVNPFKGSEDGMGWNFINQIARFNKVIAVTRENTRPAIEQALRENPSVHHANIQWVHYDLPYWMRFWKKGGRGAMLYYYLWQLFLPFFIRRKKLEFDIVHNLNFHNDWTPSMLWMLNKPFVWGPIGHHPRIPRNYVLHVYGVRAYLLEEIKWGIKKYFWRIDPLLRSTANHADTILAMNSSVAKVLHLPSAKVVHMPSVSSEYTDSVPMRKTNGFTVLSAGRFVPLKGFDITIKSFARFYHRLPEKDRTNAKLILAGDGPYKKYLHRLASELELGEAVQFIPWASRDEFRNLYKQADVFLFPSHEGAGMVVSEALSYALPVLCFRNDGPGEFVNEECSITVPYSRYDESISRFSEALHKLYFDRPLCQRLSQGARKTYVNNFDWNLKGERLRDVYSQLVQTAV